MNKQEFFTELRKGLVGLPQEDIEERLSFYREMIDDRMEEGLSEAEAVQEIGSVEAVIAQITGDISPAKPAGKPKRGLKVWEIVLLVLGFPLWFPLLVAAFVVVVALFAVLWSLIVSLWAIFGSVVGCGIGGTIAGIAFACGGFGSAGLAVGGAGVLCLGLAIFLFFGSVAASKGGAFLTKGFFSAMIKCFKTKEVA